MISAGTILSTIIRNNNSNNDEWCDCVLCCCVCGLRTSFVHSPGNIGKFIWISAFPAAGRCYLEETPLGLSLRSTLCSMVLCSLFWCTTDDVLCHLWSKWNNASQSTMIIVSWVRQEEKKNKGVGCSRCCCNCTNFTISWVPWNPRTLAPHRN